MWGPPQKGGYEGGGFLLRVYSNHPQGGLFLPVWGGGVSPLWGALFSTKGLLGPEEAAPEMLMSGWTEMPQVVGGWGWGSSTDCRMLQNHT